VPVQKFHDWVVSISRLHSSVLPKTAELQNSA
jgi:hypothetical protein